MSNRKGEGGFATTISCYMATPTWILTRMMRPFLSKSHPWKYRRFGLREWWSGQTELCRWFDIWIVVSLIGAVVAVVVFLL